MEQNQPSSLFEMEIDSYAQGHINSIGKWGKFISVTGLITVGLFLLLILFLGTRIMNAVSDIMPGGGSLTGAAGVVIAIFLVVFGLCGAWLYFLLRASTLLKKGLLTRNTIDLANGFSAMRNFFTMSIVFSILSILSTLYTLLNF
jgi:hypothetical protein